jgi:hypothetical protein
LIGYLLTVGLAPEAELPQPTLSDALWQGEIRIEVDGALYSQSMANKMGGSYGNVPIGFAKEKGEMKIGYELHIRFQINALGEVVFDSADVYEGKQSVNYQYHYYFGEEVTVEGTNVTTQRKVRSSTRKVTNVDFEGERLVADGEMAFGSLRVSPSGAMDRRGAMEFEGDFSVPLIGSGEVVVTEERDPPSEEFAVKRTNLKIERRFELPIHFLFSVKHRTEAIEGSFEPNLTPENPFGREERMEGQKDMFNNRLNARGTYRLTPLFN